MEAELRDALELYRSSLCDVREVLRHNQGDPDTTKLESELVDAIRETEEALGVQGQQQQQQQQQGQDAAAANPFPSNDGGVGSAGDLSPGRKVGPGPTHGPQPLLAQPPFPSSSSAGVAPGASFSRKRPRAAEGPQGLAGGGTKNHLIHPRNKYAYEEPDFELLAKAYPSLEQYLLPAQQARGAKSARAAEEEEDESAAGGGGGGGGGANAAIEGGGGGGKGRVVDFADEEASRELTKVLLHADFGIDWWVPLGQLVPPLTSRSNYIHWLEDLLALSSPPGLSRVRGLDVGCGSNCIYPLLGSAINGWDFVAADVTDVALEWARRNVDANPQLPGRIAVRRSGGDEACPASELCGTEGILPPCMARGERFSFTMCNPPFFASMEEAGANPNTAYSGSEAEMVYPGGEAAFVGTMIKDSSRLRGSAHWFSTMVGKKASLKAMRKALYEERVTALRTTEFCQGRTSRWALAWSWQVNPNTASQPLTSTRSAPSAAATAAAVTAAASPQAAAGAGIALPQPAASPQAAAGAAAKPRAAAGKREYRFSVRTSSAAARGGNRGGGAAKAARQPLQLLQLLCSVLGSHGVQGCKTDAATYSCEGTLLGDGGGYGGDEAQDGGTDGGNGGGSKSGDGGGNKSGDASSRPVVVAGQLFHSGAQLSLVLRLRGDYGGEELLRFADLAALVEADVQQIWEGMV